MFLQEGGRGKEGNVSPEAKCYALGVKDRGRGQAPRNRRNAAFEAGKAQETDSPYRPQGNHDFGPVKLMSDF